MNSADRYRMGLPVPELDGRELHAYCPVCGNLLEDVTDVDGRCWSVCAMAGLLQPAIHYRAVETDTYEIRNGLGDLVETIVVDLRTHGILR